MYGETGRSDVGLPDSTGGASATGAKDLEVSGELLKDFVNRVDAVLRNLEASAGNPTKVSAQAIRKTSLSNGSDPVFPEATALYSQYDRVHQELTLLSKTLHLQIEATAIAVQGAAHGFESLEEEQRQRFWAIQTEIRDIQDARDGKLHSNEAKTGARL
jgi:Zn-dependent oligopeptidase